MSVAVKAAWSTWFAGSEQDWLSLSQKEKEDIAFAATGCEAAYPTWEPPVDCVHIRCRIRRGELPKIALTNAVLRAEAESGWLHRASRERKYQVFRTIRKLAMETGIYDPWKLPGGWQLFVFGGLF
jgi:hypothetical protein